MTLQVYTATADRCSRLTQRSFFFDTLHTETFSAPTSGHARSAANRVFAIEEQLQSLESLDAHDIVQYNTLDTLQQNIHVIDHWLRQDSQMTDAGLPSSILHEAGLDCSRCGMSFQHLYTLRRHELYQRGVVTTHRYKLNIALRRVGVPSHSLGVYENGHGPPDVDNLAAGWRCCNHPPFASAASGFWAPNVEPACSHHVGTVAKSSNPRRTLVPS